MYKVIIVDDEEIIAQGLGKYISATIPEFNVEAYFEDGKEAIQYLEKKNVDVVLTDIKMSDVSGLELAQYIHKNKPDIKVVIISGYKNFEYVQRALEYRVEYFIAKPANLDEITDKFSMLKSNLDDERAKTSRISHEKERQEELEPLLRQMFFSAVTLGILTDSAEIKKRIKLIGININPDNCKCCSTVIKIQTAEEFMEKWERGKDGLKTALENFILGSWENISFYCFDSNYDEIKFVAVSEQTDKDAFNSNLDAYLDYVCGSIKKIFNLDAVYDKGEVFDSIYELANQSKNIAYKSYQMMIKSEHQDSILFLEQYKLIVSALNSGDFQLAESMLLSIFHEIKTQPISHVRNFIMEMMSIVYDKLTDIGIDLSGIESTMFNFRDIMKTDDAEQLQSIGLSFLSRVQDAIISNEMTSGELIIKKAKEYIENNYNKDISLDDVAKHIFLSPVYFSKFFKQYTGEKFIDYLIMVKMNKTIELLKMRKYKIYEICQMVGYKSSKYFTRMFKKHTGYTPKEYCVYILKVGEPDEN